MSHLLLQADARRIPLADGSAHCVVCSPPYWGLRDYGVTGQLGLEPTPDEYVANMVQVFREVRRVLRDDGTVWMNLGDSYTSGGRDTFGTFSPDSKQATHANIKQTPRAAQPSGLKPKDIIGIPWRVAFALQADGWYLRSDIIWSKPNPMPESVTDRPTKAHEYIFLLAKRERYYYDAEAVREEQAEASVSRYAYAFSGTDGADEVNDRRTVPKGMRTINPAGRNRRSVWTIPTQAFPEAHFATYPEALVEPCIKAGCPVGGIVLDPFNGSGTTGAVAVRHGRRYVGLDLSRDYLLMAHARIGKASRPNTYRDMRPEDAPLFTGALP